MSKVVDFEAKQRVPEVIDMPTYRRYERVVIDCHERRAIAVIRGGFGIGKTFMMRHYQAAHEREVALITLDPTTRSLTAGLSATCAAVAALWERVQWQEASGTHQTSYAYALTRAIERLLKDIIHAGWSPLLMVDEAQHARPDLLEALRAINDQRLCGLVIAGNERLFEPRRGRMQVADYGALLSRARHLLDIPEMTHADLDAVLDAFQINAPQSRELLAKSAAGGVREVINVIEKAQLIGGTQLVSLKHLRLAADTTGRAAFG